MHRLAVLFVFVLAVAFLGCSGEPTKVAVKGSVTFKGAPLPDGSLVFKHEDKDTPPEGAPIKDGKFAIKVKPGNHVVEILASKKMPFADGVVGPMGEKEGMQNYLPEKYNTKSELKRSVSGPTDLSFDLKDD